MMWFLLLLLHTAHIELVTPQALILRKGGNPCEGHLEVYHKNIWGYVGDSDWSEYTEKVVCASTHCGEPVTGSTRDIVKNESGTVWLNEVKCKGYEDPLWRCDNPGWNASAYQKLTVKKVKCSRNITISLEGSKCAGAVMYSHDKTTGYFCSDHKWGKNEASKKIASVVCKSLGCGEFREIPPSKHMESEKFINSKKKRISCSAFHDQEPDNLWQCVTGNFNGQVCELVAVICNDYHRLQLKGRQSNVCSGQLEEEINGVWISVTQSNFSFDVCQQMHCGAIVNQTNSSRHVTCTDKVKVVLLDSGKKESKCYGTVNIQVNGRVKPVCGSSWREKEAELVCKELNCGKLVSLTFEKLNQINGAMDHVTCNGSESSLWHCQAQRGEHVTCSSQPKIVCSASVEVKLMDGPGRCAGRLAIKYKGQWGRVANTSWTQSDTICKQLKCGAADKAEKFSQGSGNFLPINCKNAQISDISECLTDDSNTRPVAREPEAVGITCDDHKMVFLGGPEACSGQVRIQHGNKIYWLSGSKETWNHESANTVCQQMLCGSAVSFSSEKAETRSVWKESRKCSSSKESLFDCTEIRRLPPDHQNSTASVNCSGKIEMKLNNSCWGKVSVYTQAVQGDMCADTWTDEMSEKLCTHLRCGKALILEPPNRPRTGEIKFNSLHAPTPNAPLTQWTFVKTQDTDTSCNQRPAYVVCSRSVKPRFSSSSENCYGNIEMEFEGQWLPVCWDALKDTKIQNTICQELKCGGAVERLPYFGPAPAVTRSISGLTCSPGAESSLSGCTIATSPSSCEYGGLRCSDWKAMVPVGDKACSGTVGVRSGKELSAVSRQGWTETEKKRLCQHINCGAPLPGETRDQGTEINSLWSKSFSCGNDSSTKTNIWQCERETAPSGTEKLFIKCQGEPSVTLSQTCHGEVRINGTQVCAANWDLSCANKVCQEKKCGNAVNVTVGKPRSSANVYHVSCDRHHSILGQCRRTTGRCAKGVVLIYCSDSVRFRTAEKHGGELLVNYRDKWEKVCHNGSLSSKMTSDLCKETTQAGHHSDSNENIQDKVETELDCAEGVNDIRRCVKKSSCSRLLQTTITCYVTTPAPTTATPERPSLPSIIVGAMLLLLVLILIVLFIRFFVRRARKSRDPSRMLTAKDVEFESGEYEDVMDKENEMEEFSPGRLRSEDDFITENDRHSVSSLPYDDIDKADDARPLTSPDAAAPADQDVNMHDVHNENGVTYEVEDPQESYDDIDTIHETTQTKAEVHDSPQTTQDTAAPPGLAQRDEDYLEPDQDG